MKTRIALLLLFDAIIVLYLLAYVLGFVPHNGPVDWFMDGIRNGMR